MTFDKANSITGSGGVQNSDAAKKPKSTTETKQNIQIDMTGGTKNTPQNPLDFIEELTGKKIMDTPDMLAIQEHLNKSVEEENSKKAQMTPERREAYEKQQNEALLAGIEERHERAENEKTAFGRWKQGFKDDFKDVDDVGSALNAVVSRTRDGFRAIDKINPLTYVKEPVKNPGKY